MRSHASSKFQIYGNGKDEINCKDIQFSQDDHVTITAHGIQEHGSKYTGNHLIDLCKATGEKLALFSDDIQELSKGQIIHVELLSCHGGAAIHDIFYLPIGSTLMTFTSAKHPTLQSLQLKNFAQSINFEHRSNPFIKFAFYLFINPDDIQFAIHSKEGSKQDFLCRNRNHRELCLYGNYKVAEQATQ